MKKLYFKGWILLFVGGYFFNILTCYVVGNWFINYVECHLILTTSMSPTLKITSDFHDMVIINKWIYKLREPQRGDIVCFDSDRWLWHVENKIPVGNIKRIIGLPEEIIDIEPPYIMINGERLTEPLIFETISSCQNGYAGYCKNLDNVSAKTIELPITLGKDQYFIMGDNSQHSIDSRIIGVIHKNEIRGKVVRIIYPLSRFKLLD
ncbi:MAG: signal peptidase I [Planctomycetaceae bacterium]|nr:signal peptidase I [Planctomycetaceae bacterium]